ncbi:MAG: hypothetical protein BMS9Abin25_0528 [Gammaproteobacteria bacterium]|nr:MAG: hypothetical protein BMS9Abin25_0528 [Gammaproteobacteria bacterium]
MTFRQYIHQLAKKIGLHQIPVVLDATEIRYFLAEDAVHHEFVTTLVRDIYKKSFCGHLDAVIDNKKTMSLLGMVRAALLAENKTDICKIRLMNQFCEISSEILTCEYQREPVADSAQEELPERVKI